MIALEHNNIENNFMEELKILVRIAQLRGLLFWLSGAKRKAIRDFEKKIAAMAPKLEQICATNVDALPKDELLLQATKIKSTLHDFTQVFERLEEYKFFRHPELQSISEKTLDLLFKTERKLRHAAYANNKLDENDRELSAFNVQVSQNFLANHNEV